MIQRQLVLLAALTFSCAAFANLLPTDATQAGYTDSFSSQAQLLAALETASENGQSETCEFFTEQDTFWLAQGCCRVCRTGKACGDSCINRNYTCHKPPGCACNG